MLQHPLIVAVGLSLLVVVVACGRAPGPGGPAGGGPVLPESAAGWTASGPVERWDTETIYDYIDGHAEVYLAFGMRGCASRRYAGPEGEADVMVDVFELASPADAFGVFTHDRDGEEVAVGQGGRYRWGWLSFWKGRFFVSVTAEDESEAARTAVLELGRQLAASIDETGEPPALLGALPDDGLEPRTMRYLRHPLVLAAELPVGLDDPFELGGTTPAVLGRYRAGDATAWLLVVDYPEEATAERLLAARGEGPVAGARGFSGGRRLAPGSGRTAFVLEAGSAELATELLEAAVAAAGGAG